MATQPLDLSNAPMDERGLNSGQLAKGFRLLAITTFLAAIMMNVPQTISPNFFRDEIGMDGAANAVLIAIRELPGFLLIFVAALLLRQGLARATAISLGIAGVGYIMFAGANTFIGLILPTLITSIGYHSWLQLQDALGLSLARNGEEGTVLGRYRSIGFAGTIFALVLTMSVLMVVAWNAADLSQAAGGVLDKIGKLLGGGYADALRSVQGPWLRGLYVFSGIAALIAAVAIVRFPVSMNAKAAAKAAPRITWRREYGLYYWLSFLDGSRMQIYFAFAPFVLVEVFNVDALTLSTLLLVSALINWRAGRVVGRMVDRYGEKRVLTVGYSLHLVVFLGFAFSQNVWLLYLTYLGYNFLFLFSIGTTTYLRKICRPEDLAPSLAMGISLSHVTAIVVPLIGAAVWDRYGYQFPFLFGTVFIFASLWLTQKINIPAQRVPGSPGWQESQGMAEEEMSADAAILPGQQDGFVVSPSATEALGEEDAT